MAKLVASQFRESAIVRNARPESLDDRAQLTAPREWAVLACLVLALAAIFVWGVIGSVERTLRLDGVLVLSGERRTLLSGASGEIVEILTRAGERAGSGQTVLRVALSGMERRVRSAAASVRRLENEAQRAAGAAPAEARQLRALVRAMLDELAALQAADEVVSPGDGVVAAILVAPGQTIPVGAPVADIVLGDADRLEAVAFVGPGESWPFTPGLAARVNVKSGGGEPVASGQTRFGCTAGREPPEMACADAPGNRGPRGGPYPPLRDYGCSGAPPPRRGRAGRKPGGRDALPDRDHPRTHASIRSPAPVAWARRR